MNLNKRPIHQKAGEAPKDRRYMARVAKMPCVICEHFGETQESRTTVHHWIMGRGGNRRTPDNETIPLCDGHHQGMFDTSKTAIHREPELWREKYGTDEEWSKVIRGILR